VSQGEGSTDLWAARNLALGMPIFNRLEQQAVIDNPVELHRNSTGSFRVVGSFLIEKSAKIALTPPKLIASGVYRNTFFSTKMHKFLFSCFFSFYAASHTDRQT